MAKNEGYKVQLEIEIVEYGIKKEIKDCIEEDEYIVQYLNNLIKKQKQPEIPQNGRTLFRLRQSLNNKNKFEIVKIVNRNLKKNDQESIHYLNRYAWLIINGEDKQPNEDYILNEDDVIKIGNRIYLVFKKNFDKNDSTNNISQVNKNIGSIFAVYDITQNAIGEGEKCRRCGQGREKNSKESEPNPLFKPCSCKGLIHYKCLKKEISEMFKDIKMNQIFSIECNCSNCFDPYPLRIFHNEGNLDLIDYNLIDFEKYIILENLNSKEREINNNNSENKKLVHFISLNGNEITIGRNDENDVIDKDKAISKFHAVLKYNDKNDNLILENKSSNGTFVLIKGNIEIKEKAIKFQINNNTISNCITANLIKKKKEEKTVIKKINE
jgi:hypothetical protein